MFFRAQCMFSPGQDADGIAVVPGVPEDLIRLYYQHETFGERFRKFVDDLTEQYGTVADYKEANRTGPGTKRAGTSEATDSAKRARKGVAPVAVDELTGVETRKAGQIANYQSLPKLSRPFLMRWLAR